MPKPLFSLGFRPGKIHLEDISRFVGTGFFPGERDQVYSVEQGDLFLVGTSEVPLAAMHGDEIFDADELPLRYAGYSTCFRVEAGTYGKDTRGIFRVHQFDKVEMVAFERPADSADTLEWMTERAEICLLEGRRGAMIVYKRQGEVISHYVVPRARGDERAPARRRPSHQGAGRRQDLRTRLVATSHR